MTHSETQCVHLDGDPNQARARFSEPYPTPPFHLCAVCTADKLTAMLRQQTPVQVAHIVTFRDCSHIREGARWCPVCLYGVTGSLMLLWSWLRSQGVSREANRLLRLLKVLGREHAPLLGRLGMNISITRKETAILNSNRWERRG